VPYYFRIDCPAGFAATAFQRNGNASQLPGQGTPVNCIAANGATTPGIASVSEVAPTANGAGTVFVIQCPAGTPANPNAVATSSYPAAGPTASSRVSCRHVNGPPFDGSQGVIAGTQALVNEVVQRYPTGQLTTGPDYSGLTNASYATGIIAALITTGAVIAGAYVVRTAARLLTKTSKG